MIHVKGGASTVHKPFTVRLTVNSIVGFGFPLSPMDKGLILFSLKVNEGEEQPLPLQVAVSFRVSEKPRRIIALRSATETLKLDDPAFDRLTVPWENDPLVWE